tara:strand:- start:2854 stop:3300 length:447 start_codon:yes stop_codon:yes gene_type:complete
MEPKNQILGGIPRLIEPGAKYFISASLDKCREFKLRHYNFLYNFGMFVGLVSVVSSILYFKYKRKNDKLYQEQLRIEKEEYIKNRVNFAHNLQRIQMDQVNKGALSAQQLITSLPLPYHESPMQAYMRQCENDLSTEADRTNLTKRFL